MDLHYQDPNPGGYQIVLLLHGLGANASSWTLQFDPLAEAGYRPIAVDAPGFGDSPYRGRGWPIDAYAAQLAELVSDLGASSVHVVGISMGGVVAEQFALDYPNLTSKLVLANTFAVMKPTNLSSWLYLLVRMSIIHTLGMTAQAKIVGERVFPRDDQAELREQFMQQVAKANPHAYRAAMHALIRFDVRSRLYELRMPTLVITGENDTTVPLKNQKILVENIPGARQLLVPNAGHAVSVDSYEIFNQELLSFLKE